MRYEDDELGYSFQLPDGWRVAKNIRPLTFFGPQGQMGLTTENIQIHIGGILLRYTEPSAREEFMAEPGASVRRAVLGEETNVMICEWHDHSEISAVRDGVQYTIVHPHDVVTLEAVSLLQATFQFPSTDRSATTLQRHSDPAVQTMARVEPALSKEARTILETSPALDSVENLETVTAYRLRQRDQRSERSQRGREEIDTDNQLSPWTLVVLGTIATVGALLLQTPTIMIAVPGVLTVVFFITAIRSGQKG